MVEIRAYKFEDALEIEPSETGVKKHPDYEKWAKMNEHGPAYTLLVNNEIIGCGGVRIFWEGCGEAWSILKDKTPQLLNMMLLEVSKKQIDKIIKECKLRWIQMSVRTDFSKGIHFVQFLGFKRKCEMKGYLPDGSDALLYARETEL